MYHNVPEFQTVQKKKQVWLLTHAHWLVLINSYVILVDSLWIPGGCWFLLGRFSLVRVGSHFITYASIYGIHHYWVFITGKKNFIFNWYYSFGNTNAFPEIEFLTWPSMFCKFHWWWFSQIEKLMGKNEF